MNIFKYVVPHTKRSTVQMPTGAKITHVAMQATPEGSMQICAWALVPDGEEVPMADVKFAIVGTGNTVPAGFTYAGILILEETRIIQHVFFEAQDAPISKI